MIQPINNLYVYILDAIHIYKRKFYMMLLSFFHNPSFPVLFAIMTTAFIQLSVILMRFFLHFLFHPDNVLLTLVFPALVVLSFVGLIYILLGRRTARELRVVIHHCFSNNAEDPHLHLHENGINI